MGQMLNVQKLEQIYLVSDAAVAEQEWVTMDVSPLKTKDIVGIRQNMAEVEIAAAMLASRITEWTYVDAEGVMMPITFENICNLHIDDFNLLASKIPQPQTSLDDTEKKSLEPTLPPFEKIEVTQE